MYSFVDQPPRHLSDGSHFLLCAMRAWVASAVQQRCPSVALAPAFSRAGLLDMIGDFSDAMGHFHRCGTRTFSFGPMGLARITEIEAVMLALWADMTSQNHDRARAVLLLLVTEGQVDCLIALMARITMRMERGERAPTGWRAPSERDSGVLRRDR